MHRQPSPPYDYDIEDCKAILLGEAEKLFTSLAKRMVDEAIDEHTSKTSASLLLLPLNDKQQQLTSFIRVSSSFTSVSILSLEDWSKLLLVDCLDWKDWMASMHIIRSHSSDTEPTKK
jgi:hypothetical protein